MIHTHTHTYIYNNIYLFISLFLWIHELRETFMPPLSREFMNSCVAPGHFHMDTKPRSTQEASLQAWKSEVRK